VRIQVGQRNDRQDQVDDFVTALHHPGEVPQQPALHALHDVVAIGVELGDGTQDAAIHQADDRHQHRALELDAANQQHKHQPRGEADHQRKQHAYRHAGSGHQGQRQQDAKLGGIQAARGGRLDKLVAHKMLQDHPAHRQANASEHQCGQAWQATGSQGQPGIPRPLQLPRPHQQRGHAKHGKYGQPACTHQACPPIRQPLATRRCARKWA